MKTKDYLIDVGIFLRGDNLDPNAVSKELNIMPSSSQYKGENKVTSTNHEYVTDIGVWELAAESVSSVLSDHINQLSSKIGTLGTSLRNIEGVQEAYVDVYISTEADDDGEGTCEFVLSEENMAVLAQLGLPVRFTAAIVKK